ncbi:MAG: dTDP-4-dehydrorhamnose 3,5-epimerase [Patescibacteria group bacterium]|nr:MAG: dTDP-4-dehydrorhamnose 3,5-epimerase [Patescibacteria group bacterium]
MVIEEIRSLAIPEVKIIRYKRFSDDRGYFTETYRQYQFKEEFLRDFQIYQINESKSRANVVRGLHIQWNPYMGKLVRTLYGHMVDLVVDVRVGSPTFGKGLMYDMPARLDENYGEWIWVPVGFVHGNYYLQDSAIEYFCTGWWSPETEAGVNPYDKNIDWSLSDKSLVKQFLSLKNKAIMSEKDRNAMSLTDWKKSSASKQFIYPQ